MRECLQSGTQGALLKEAIKKAGIGPSHKDCRAVGRKSGPRALIRKRAERGSLATRRRDAYKILYAS